MTTKTNPGNFFEDFTIGQEIIHATPRTVTEGEQALYRALYPTRFALYSSDIFAMDCGLDCAPIEDLAAFHVVFGKTVPDVSLNAVANLGYAQGRFLRPVYPGDTLSTRSTVIGLKENSNGKSGVVYVRSVGRNQADEVVIDYCRWVMVRKRDAASPAPETVIPDLPKAVAPEDLAMARFVDFSNYDMALAGSPYRWGDYAIGEKIDHIDGVTVEEAEHMIATRLWQNTAKVHYDASLREDGRRLIYGGHVISMARALSFNGLGNAQIVAAINGGAHVAPLFGGDTLYCWSEILDKAETANPSVGALRLRLVATKNRPCADFPLRGEDGKYADGVILDFDLWALIPR